MMRRLKLMSVCLLTAFSMSACTFSVYDLPLPGGADVGDHPYSVKVQFRDVLDLVPQSAVKVDDVTVGEISDIRVQGWTALVTLRINADVKLPENTFASIRQTSLLGEKFVSLAPPSEEAPSGRLSDGDTIPLSRSGRNPEVEEVLGALSLLLNGGGVAQLKTISTELNKALGGREADIRDLLKQLDTFMGQLDRHKHEVVRAIRAVNALAKEVKKQKASIIRTLDQIPHALKVIDEQRAGLVKMLKGLQRLKPVAVHVIRASKKDTLAALRDLDPILTQLANAGDALPKSLQAFLTYPFVNAAVGRTPTEARNLQPGDFTNLSADLDLDLDNLPTVGLPSIPNPCSLVPDLPTCPTLSIPTLPTVTLPSVSLPTQVCKRGGLPCDDITDCLHTPTLTKCKSLVKSVCKRLGNSSNLCGSLTGTLCQAGKVLNLCKPGGGDGSGGGSGGDGSGNDGGLLDPVCNLAPALCRPAVDYRKHRTVNGYDKDLALLLMQGVSR
ncbi:MAG: MCE family protein [Nocardioidaceae bacterium]